MNLENSYILRLYADLLPFILELEIALNMSMSTHQKCLWLSFDLNNTVSIIPPYLICYIKVLKRDKKRFEKFKRTSLRRCYFDFYVDAFSLGAIDALGIISSIVHAF